MFEYGITPLSRVWHIDIIYRHTLKIIWDKYRSRQRTYGYKIKSCQTTKNTRSKSRKSGVGRPFVNMFTNW